MRTNNYINYFGISSSFVKCERIVNESERLFSLFVPVKVRSRVIKEDLGKLSSVVY